MQPPKLEDDVVFHTPWFEVFTRRWAERGETHYGIHAPDFVAIVAQTPAGELLMVRQFRPIANAFTLELPAGHVEHGETPEAAARKELAEETGYEADTFELLAKLSPSTARYTNCMWCFFAAGARRRREVQLEAGMEPVLYRKGFAALLEEPEFFSSGSCAALFAAAVKGKLKKEFGS